MDLPYSADLAEGSSSLARAARPVLDSLQTQLSGIRVSVFLTDERGWLLERRSGETSVDRRLDTLQLAPGFCVTEQAIGTNGIGTALTTRRPAFVRGREHFADSWSGLACAGVPIHDPLSGRVIGVVDLTSLQGGQADPAMMAMALNATRAIEQRLLEGTTSRERALLEAFQAARRRMAVGGPSTMDTPADELLTPRDRRILEECATALISSRQTGLLEVPLTDGRTAALLTQPVESPSGVTGFAVEAVLPSGDLRRLTAPAPDTTPPTYGPPPPPLTATCTTGAPAEPLPDTGRWLLAVGEPGVGRLALRARQRLELLCDAGACVGTTLDVARTAEELAKVVVPRFADFATVDLPEAVLRGEEPTPLDGTLRRAAIAGLDGGAHLYPAGAQVAFAPSTPQARALDSGEPVLEPVLARAPGWIAQEPARTEKILAAGVHSLIAVPLVARGATLGLVNFYRAKHQEPFEEDDLSLAAELVGRAAVCIDNARRFTHEHTVALALQRSMLPRGLPAQQAVEAAHRYLPARSGVGGDWFDVIPLSGTRVALVVGDVVGHGLHAAATMGRLRTAVHNLSALDLAVDEILTQLDDLVGRLDLDRDEAGPETDGEEIEEIIGATCLYAVYDPTTRRCTLGRAGHPPPALVRPDGTVRFVDLSAGPPLGLGGLPFESTDIEIPEGSRLVLYTDGLIEALGDGDPESGLDRLERALTQRGRTPEQTCQALDALLPCLPDDDIALLVARTRALDASHIASWELPADPAVVARIRSDVTAQLADWGLQELEFATELTVSELVTNAIRYGGEPITLRLLLDRSLICEVSDGSSTSPHLRRARTTDEGGRGLFLVAQLSQRWGTRYTPTGKVLWTEQPLNR
ncbi:SpoIIE family protein phosphatase [Streptomyces sparsogenes]|uniref:SpoIIE family protein phosphatase n=1 Tax=Streptomyces sparsogenes TaxID=67365 RepID=UPI0033E66954